MQQLMGSAAGMTMQGKKSSAEDQQPLPLIAPTGEAGSVTSDQTRAPPAPQQPTPSKKKKKAKQTKQTAVGERSKPTMELSREVLKKLQLADGELGPVLRGETDTPELYSIEDGIVPELRVKRMENTCWWWFHKH